MIFQLFNLRNKKIKLVKGVNLVQILFEFLSIR